MSLMFTINVSETAWNKDLGGWICSVLKIPTSKINAIYVEGKLLDNKNYSVLHEHHIIQWTSEQEHPKNFTASVVIEKELSTKELTLRWKKLAILIPVLCSLLFLILGIFIITKSCELRIEYPTANAIIKDGKTKVSGITKNIPKGKQIWLVVYSFGRSTYYPQKEIMVNKDGNWDG